MASGPSSAILSDVIARHAPRLLALPGVIGIGEGQVAHRPCLVLMVNCPDGELPDLPATLEGYPVIVERTGRFQAQGLK